MSRRRRSRANSSGSHPRAALFPTLDLHGYTADEAERVARQWLSDRRNDGEATVRVITGRGLHSIGPPVLIGAIEDLLTDLAGAMVDSFEIEPGGGGYRVRLTHRKGRRPEGVIRPSRTDPALAREAEESLIELGIQPTPPLIEAEAKRIARERGREAG